MPQVIGFLILLCFSIPLRANESGVAKVIMMKGEAKLFSKNGPGTALQKDQWIAEGQTIKTEPKSFVKLLFIDKSQMNLGPESQMEITKFPKESAGVINLLTGSLRSKVSKDYSENQQTDKSKLIVKTKTAAMGVRGTDFQVSFDSKTETTGLDVWEGQVAMAKIDHTPGTLDANALDNILNTEGISVSEGTEAVADPKSQAPPEIRPMPVEKLEAGKMDTVVLDSNTNEKPDSKNEAKLETKNESKTEIKNETKTEVKNESKVETKFETKMENKPEIVKAPEAPKNEVVGLRDIIPPGVPRSNFTNDAGAAGATLQGVISSSAIAAVEKQVTNMEGHGPAIARAPASADFSPPAPGGTSPLPGGNNMPLMPGAAPVVAGQGTLSPPPPLPSLQIFEMQQQINNTIVQTQTQNTNTIIQNNIGNVITSDVVITVIAN